MPSGFQKKYKLLLKPNLAVAEDGLVPGVCSGTLTAPRSTAGKPLRSPAGSMRSLHLLVAARGGPLSTPLQLVAEEWGLAKAHTFVHNNRILLKLA